MEITEWYGVLQDEYLSIVPPTGDRITFDAGVFGIDPKHFPDAFLDALVGQEQNDFIHYIISVTEDPISNDRLFYNVDGELIGVVPASKDYDPAALMAVSPGNAEPWQVEVRFRLLHMDDLEAYEASAALAQIQSEPSIPGGMQPLSEGGPFRITAMDRVALHTELTFPGDAACYYTVESCPDLGVGMWTTVDLFLGIAADMTWIGPDDSSAPQFFLVHQIPQSTPEDQDQDGIGDVVELTLGTDPLDSDTDGDGLLDGWEVSNQKAFSLQSSCRYCISNAFAFLGDMQIRSSNEYVYLSI